MTALDDAVMFVTAVLCDGERPAREVTGLAATEGISAATLRRAVKAARIVKRKEGQPGTEQKWVWSLPQDDQPDVNASGPGGTHLRAGEILAGLVLENGKTWGECASPIQVSDAEAVLASDPPARRFWVGRGRGYSKTTDAGALTIAAVLGGVIEPGERGLFAAADKDQARLAADAISGWARRSDLGGLVVVEAGRVRFPRHDVEIEIMSSDAPSAWGRRASWFVIDELPAWADAPNSRAFYEAISTAFPKVPHSRVLIIGTASSPAHFSHAIHEAALTDPQWRVSDTHDIAPWLNPADIEGERRRLSAASFSRLWCNEWVEAEDHLVTSAALARCATLTDWPVKAADRTRYVIGCDIGVKFDNTAIAVGHTETERGERRVVLDDLALFKPRQGVEVPLKEVEDRVETLARRYHGATVYFDPSQAYSMMQSLKGRRVRVEETRITSKWNDSMATLLHTMLRDGLVDLPADHQELLDELRTVRVVETSAGLLSIDTRPGLHDDMTDALGLVAMRLMERSTATARFGSSADMPPMIFRREAVASTTSPNARTTR